MNNRNKRLKIIFIQNGGKENSHIFRLKSLSYFLIKIQLPSLELLLKIRLNQLKLKPNNFKIIII
jgi:hypothetical protein